MPIKLTKGLFTNAIEGDAEVVEGEEITIEGMLMGDLKVQPSAVVRISGMVSGNLYVGEKSKVILEGLIGKSVINNGGSLRSVVGK